jgi:hypothetical protein
VQRKLSSRCDLLRQSFNLQQFAVVTVSLINVLVEIGGVVHDEVLAAIE